VVVVGDRRVLASKNVIALGVGGARVCVKAKLRAGRFPESRLDDHLLPKQERGASLL
jgi:hypothetical protein